MCISLCFSHLPDYTVWRIEVRKDSVHPEQQGDYPHPLFGLCWRGQRGRVFHGRVLPSDGENRSHCMLQSCVVIAQSCLVPLYVVITRGVCTILCSAVCCKHTGDCAILLHFLFTQYYNIKAIAVAPYDYINDGNATHPTCPPLLHAVVVQYNKWNFDASNHNIYLSPGTHESELWEGRGRGWRRYGR